MHSHRYCSPMRSTEMKTGPSLFLWTSMQNHRYFYGPSATTAKRMEKNQMDVLLYIYPTRRTKVRLCTEHRCHAIKLP